MSNFMVKHSGSVGHQAQHATWAEPRPAHCCCQRGKWFVCGVEWIQQTDNQTNTYFGYMYHVVTEWTVYLRNPCPLCLPQVSIAPTHAELGDLLLCLYPPSLHGLCCCKPAQCRAPSDSQGYHPTSTATIYWYRSPLMSVENEIVFEYLSMQQLFYTSDISYILSLLLRKLYIQGHSVRMFSVRGL